MQLKKSSQSKFELNCSADLVDSMQQVQLNEKEDESAQMGLKFGAKAEKTKLEEVFDQSSLVYGDSEQIVVLKIQFCFGLEHNTAPQAFNSPQDFDLEVNVQLTILEYTNEIQRKFVEFSRYCCFSLVQVDYWQFYLKGTRISSDKKLAQLGVFPKSVILCQCIIKKVPYLSLQGYSMNYTIEELMLMKLEELERVKNFRVSNSFGSVEFPGEVDITYLNLDKIISIENNSAEVYPDSAEADLFYQSSEKPPVGSKLNRKAIISFNNCVIAENLSKKNNGQIDPDVIRNSIQTWCKKNGCTLVALNVSTGAWSFQVEHFTKYKLDDDEISQECANEPQRLEANSQAPGNLNLKDCKPEDGDAESNLAPQFQPKQYQLLLNSMKQPPAFGNNSASQMNFRAGSDHHAQSQIQARHPSTIQFFDQQISSANMLIQAKQVKQLEASQQRILNTLSQRSQEKSSHDTANQKLMLESMHSKEEGAEWGLSGKQESHLLDTEQNWFNKKYEEGQQKFTLAQQGQAEYPQERDAASLASTDFQKFVQNLNKNNFQSCQLEYMNLSLTNNCLRFPKMFLNHSRPFVNPLPIKECNRIFTLAKHSSLRPERAVTYKIMHIIVEEVLKIAKLQEHQRAAQYASFTQSAVKQLYPLMHQQQQSLKRQTKMVNQQLAMWDLFNILFVGDQAISIQSYMRQLIKKGDIKQEELEGSQNALIMQMINWINISQVGFKKGVQMNQNSILISNNQSLAILQKQLKNQVNYTNSFENIFLMPEVNSNIEKMSISQISEQIILDYVNSLKKKQADKAQKSEITYSSFGSDKQSDRLPTYFNFWFYTFLLGFSSLKDYIQVRGASFAQVLANLVQCCLDDQEFEQARAILAITQHLVKQIYQKDGCAEQIQAQLQKLWADIAFLNPPNSQKEADILTRLGEITANMNGFQYTAAFDKLVQIFEEQKSCKQLSDLEISSLKQFTQFYLQEVISTAGPSVLSQVLQRVKKICQILENSATTDLASFAPTLLNMTDKFGMM